MQIRAKFSFKSMIVATFLTSPYPLLAFHPSRSQLGGRAELSYHTDEVLPV